MNAVMMDSCRNHFIFLVIFDYSIAWVIIDWDVAVRQHWSLISGCHMRLDFSLGLFFLLDLFVFCLCLGCQQWRLFESDIWSYLSCSTHLMYYLNKTKMSLDHNYNWMVLDVLWDQDQFPYSHQKMVCCFQLVTFTLCYSLQSYHLMCRNYLCFC